MCFALQCEVFSVFPCSSVLKHVFRDLFLCLFFLPSIASIDSLDAQQIPRFVHLMFFPEEKKKNINNMHIRRHLLPAFFFFFSLFAHSPFSCFPVACLSVGVPV